MCQNGLGDGHQGRMGSERQPLIKCYKTNMKLIQDDLYSVGKSCVVGGIPGKRIVERSMNK